MQVEAEQLKHTLKTNHTPNKEATNLSKNCV